MTTAATQGTGRPARSGRSAAGRLVDRVSGHDIGLVRLIAALRMLVCVPVGLLSGYLLARPLGLPAVVAMMVATLPAFLCCLVVVDEKPWRDATRSGALVVPFVLALYLALELHPYRWAELVVLVVLLFVQFYGARFGTFVGDFGVMAFGSYLCGLLLPLPATSFLGLATIGATSLAATVLVRTVLFRPDPYRSLLRSERAFLAVTRSVLEAAVDVLEQAGEATGPPVRTRRKLDRRQTRMQEAALLADGVLADAGPRRSAEAAEELHRLLFDTELSVEGLGRHAALLAAPSGAPFLAVAPGHGDARARVARALQHVLDHGRRAGDTAAADLLGWLDRSAPAAVTGDAALVHRIRRIAVLLADLADEGRRWQTIRAELPPSDSDAVPFESPVSVTNGRVAGAKPVLEATLAGGGMSGPWRRWRISAPLRTAVQGAVAVAVVEPLASLLGGSRFYWGVIGVLVILAGTNSTHERVRKTGRRLVGTVVGGLVGVPLALLLGVDHPVATVVVVVVCLVVGTYYFFSTYAVWVAALVVLLCQVYELSGGNDATLIPLRLAENALGAVVAVVVSAVVLPVRTRALIGYAVAAELVAVQEFLELSCLDETARPALRTPRLRSAARAVDQASWQLEAVMNPLVALPTGGPYRHEQAVRATMLGIARYVRQLAAQPDPDRPLSGAARARLDHTTAALHSSVALLVQVVRNGSAETTTWKRVGGVVDTLERPLPSAEQELVTARLQLLGRMDEALSILAERFGVVVETSSPVTSV